MSERRGSVRQRGTDSWQLRVYRGIDPDTGRQRYVTRTVHGSRRSAQRELDALVAEIDNAATHAGTLAELLERWSAASSTEWKPSTQATVRWATTCHLVPHLGHLPVAKLTAVDIADFYAFLLRCGGPEGCGLAVDTVRRIHGVLHQAMARALLWDWIWMNPAAGACPPRARKSEIRPPEPGWVAQLLDWTHTYKPLLFVLLRMAATTGARRSQLMALRWRDVDLDRGTVAFTRALVIGPHGPVLTATKTNRTYQVDLDRETWKVLHEWRDTAGRRARDAGVTLPVEAFVFTGKPDGHKPYSPSWATASFNAARRACGLPHFRLHDLRHFMATQMLACEVPLATVAARLNHARISTTVNVYTHAIRAWDRPAAETLSDIITTGERGSAWRVRVISSGRATSLLRGLAGSGGLAPCNCGWGLSQVDSCASPPTTTRSPPP